MKKCFVLMFLLRDIIKLKKNCVVIMKIEILFVICYLI